MMREGSVLVDVAIDQGGCFETSKATTHEEPIYVVDGVVHYCVANMPGAVPRTSTFALNNATLPFTLALADKGAKQAMLDDPHLLEGLNVHRGMVTYEDVARDLGYDYVPALRRWKRLKTLASTWKQERGVTPGFARSAVYFQNIPFTNPNKAPTIKTTLGSKVSTMPSTRVLGSLTYSAEYKKRPMIKTAPGTRAHTGLRN